MSRNNQIFAVYMIAVYINAYVLPVQYANTLGDFGLPIYALVWLVATFTVSLAYCIHYQVKTGQVHPVLLKAS